MAELLDAQKQLLRSLDRALENFKKIGKNNLTPAKVRNRISALKGLWDQIQSGHIALRNSIPAATQQSIDYFRDNLYEVSEELFLNTSDFMAESLEALEPYVSPNQSFEQRPLNSSSSFALTHLPPIKLVSFDGKYEEWESFRDRFTSLIIENPELTNFSRMHFLTSSLKDRALECIKNLPITADNFSVAWDILKSRFESQRRLINVHMLALLNLPAVTRESAQELQTLRDKVNATVNALKNLQRSPDDLWNDMLVCLVSQNLDSVTRKAWNLKNSEGRLPPSFESLQIFLDARIRALEEWRLPTHSAEKIARSPKSSSISSSTVTSITNLKCSLCKSQHYLSSCPQFTSKSLSQRREFVRKDNRCFNCLSKSHAVQGCTSKYTCRHCHKKHHTSLHENSDSSSKVDEGRTSNQPSTFHNNPTTEVNSLFSSTTQGRQRSTVLLATAWITVRAPSGRTIDVRALLDQGSEMTFISEKLAQNLRLKRFRMPISVSAIGGVSLGTIRHAARIAVMPRNHSTPAVASSALILPSLTAYSPKCASSDSALNHLRDLPWADPDPTSSSPIDILIGADIYGELLLEGVRKSKLGRPIAQQSIFGWIISGPVSTISTSNQSSAAMATADAISPQVHSNHCFSSLSLEKEIQKFWEIEELPRSIRLTPDDEKCEEHFRRTHSRCPDGRYIVRLPFKRGPPIEIGNSRAIAAKNLHWLTRRLQSLPEREKEYTAFLEEYENLGHMEKTSTDDSQDSQRVYIPHHPVIRDSSATTRLRVVFNASSATTNGSSLNDHLLVGPKLQTELTSVIVKWRQFKYVYTADITKMYRQIRIHSDDANYQRILWQTNASSVIQEFKLLTVTYGTASAPFLALRVLKQLAQDDGHDFPLAVPVLQDQIYVDDILFGGDELGLVRKIRDQLKSLLQRGGFEARKWASNSLELLTDIDPDNHGLACAKTLQADENLKILGISWNPSRDILQYHVKLDPEIPKTKRSILSTIARQFDPLGWVTPVTITTKIFMQRLWSVKLNWDDEIPRELAQTWQTMYSQLIALNDVRLPRWTGRRNNSRTVELHGFADASSIAYAAAVYLKIVSDTGDVTISLLAAKSKVAPLRPVSIPRLELLAAVLLTKLMKFVRGDIQVNDSECQCWTDSTIVLAWLIQHPSKWKTFVANRVADIQSQLPNVSWRHVPSSDNPADCASRGLLGAELVAHKLWWKGPTWLSLSQEHWPPEQTILHSDAALEQRVVTVQIANSPPEWDLAQKYSSWPKLIRVTAYIRKFVDRCRPPHIRIPSERSRASALSAAERSRARIFWLKRIQLELFPNEIAALNSKQPLSSRSSLVSLNPFIDSDGLLRVGGRLQHASLSFLTKHPIILGAHALVTLMIRQAHLRTLHAGLQLTLATLRQEVWILRARSVVRNVIHKCVVCTREKASIPQQLMGDLPALRVTRPSRSFVHCGIDYAGPIQVRTSGGRGVKSNKAYIALFICLATRAIHLELVGNYSTSAFLDAYSRFCARRGLPAAMYSDNGTTFVGANKELASAYRAALRDPAFINSTANDTVTWHFIPPSAPHFGGLWEAGVRSVKHHLSRMLQNHTLTFEELATLLCRIEACLNSRPLAPLKDTFDDYDTLTPGHFLIGSSITMNPEPSLLNLRENRLSRWQIVRQCTDRFWKLWQNDYINTLQQRGKWRTEKDSVKIGQLVLLRNSNLPPCKWELGRITQCHPGLDGLVRVVTVKTAVSEYKRPIVKICLLPIDLEDKSQ